MRSISAVRAPYVAPVPGQLAEMREEMEEYNRSPAALAGMEGAMRTARTSLYPYVAGARDRHAMAARIMCAQESTHLRQARLYYADSETTAATLAAAATAPGEAVSAARPPSPSGMIVFESPLGWAETQTGLPGGADGGPPVVAIPIVAATWSLWTPAQTPIAGSATQWVANTAFGREVCEPHLQGLWVTFYTAAGAMYRALDPRTLVSVSAPDGEAITAGQMDAALTRAGRPALSWENETVLQVGRRFPSGKAALGVTGSWSEALYTAWQLMAQSGRHAWIETETITRTRAGRRRDRRAGITASGDVHVVRLRANRRPSAGRTGAPGEHPASEYRWEVPPYRSPNRCLDSHRHATGGCTHEERIIGPHINGPKDAPVRKLRGPVYLWDEVPSEAHSR